MTQTMTRQPAYARRSPAELAPHGSIDPTDLRDRQGRVEAITFGRRIPGLGVAQVYSRLACPAIGREALTTADLTTEDGTRLSASSSVGSINYATATRILTNHLLPDLKRQSRAPRI